MSNINRRSFLKGTGIAATLPLMGVASNVLAKEKSTVNTGTTLDYPETTVGNAQKLAVNEAVNFSYPDSASPCAMIRMGKAVPGGVGPDKDIVAFSILCSHMGCALIYDATSRTFKCPCHFSIFDSEKSGQMVIGQATENLPQIQLSFDDKSGEIKAIGVDGLIFGRQANIG